MKMPANMRLHPVSGISKLPTYPFLVLFAYLPFMLYMHHSKTGPRGLDINTLGERITYYHADLILYVTVAGLLWLTPTLRRWSFTVFTTLYFLAISDWFSWHTQNKAFFFADLYRAIQLVVYYPEFVSELPGGLKAKAVILVMIPILIFFTLRLNWTHHAVKQARPILNAFSGLVVLGVIAPTPWLLSDSYTHQNSIAHMVSEQIHERKLSKIPANRATMAVTLGHNSPEEFAFPEHTAPKPTGDNIIIFVIETAPFPQYPDLYELAAELEHPWLKDNGVVFEKHYGTYPASDRGSYSILSGLYPPMLQHNNWKIDMQYGDSLAKATVAQGYESFLFSTAPLSFYDDDIMYKNLGFKHLAEVEGTRNLRTKTENGYQWDRARLYDMDSELIQKVIDLIHQRQNTREQHPFIASIAPQSSHAPFNCPPEYREHPEACNSDEAKIRTNARWQFSLLERLIKALDAHGLLDTTLIIVTGDHGIRSQHETALFPNPNLLQQSTYHIPLMLASSRLGNAPKRISAPTSHIDIAPTALDLVGINRNQLYFHGRNLFAESPRTIYFIGTGYSPATGFLKEDRFYMENRSNSLYLSAPEMDFNNREHVAQNEQTRKIIQEELLQLEAFLRKEYKKSTNRYQ